MKCKLRSKEKILGSLALIGWFAGGVTSLLILVLVDLATVFFILVSIRDWITGAPVESWTGYSTTVPDEGWEEYSTVLSILAVVFCFRMLRIALCEDAKFYFFSLGEVIEKYFATGEKLERYMKGNSDESLC